MKMRKLKIFYRQIDENGKVFGPVGVHSKEYTYYGHAQRVASERYGCNTGYTYRIDVRDPWQQYITTVVCNACGRTFTATENTVGRAITSYFRIQDIETEAVDRLSYGKNSVCQDCTRKIMDFVKSLREG